MTCKRLLLCSLCCLLCCAPALCLGAASDVVSDGTMDRPRAPDGVASDGTMDRPRASDGVVSDGAVDKPGTASDGALSDGAVPAKPGVVSDGLAACTPATPRRCCPPRPAPKPNVPLPLWVSVPETGSPERAAMFVCILGGACCLLARMIACKWRRR